MGEAGPARVVLSDIRSVAQHCHGLVSSVRGREGRGLSHHVARAMRDKRGKRWKSDTSDSSKVLQGRRSDISDVCPDTITGGAGADALSGGAGDNDFVYTALAQGGNVVRGNATARLTAGDVITGFVTTDDQINIAAVATGTNAALTVGAGTGQTFDSDDQVGGTGVGLISVALDFTAGVSTEQEVINALRAGYNTAVTVGAGDTAYFAIADTNAGAVATFFNIFAVQNTTAVALTNGGLAGSGVNFTLVASTTPGAAVALGDFILV